MLKFNQLRTYFWHIDPGYFNLNQAVKTILAILLALWLVRGEHVVTKVIAGVVSGASVQGVIATSLASRIVHIVVFDVLYFTALALGYVARGSPSGIAILLVLWGFFVNYIRRFGLDNSKAPLMAWTLCFLATIVPLNESVRLNEILYGVFVGFFVSGLVITCIFPENYSQLFINNSNRFFQNLAEGLEEMRCYAWTLNEKKFITPPFVSRSATLENLLSNNQAIQQNMVFTEAQKKISHVLMHQYALQNAYSLMAELYRTLWAHHRQLPHEAVLAINFISEEFIRLFSTTKVSKNFIVSTECPIIFLPNLAEKLGKVSLTEPAIIMVLLNFKLSFDLLSQHEAQLLRGVDEA